MARHYHLPFSPGYDFVVDRPMTIQGREYQRGEILDKTPVSDQLLRQLYEQRRIRPAGFEDGPKPAYLENGRGIADKISAELAKEEEGASDAATDEPAPAQEADAGADGIAADDATAAKAPPHVKRQSRARTASGPATSGPAA